MSKYLIMIWMNIKKSKYKKFIKKRLIVIVKESISKFLVET